MTKLEEAQKQLRDVQAKIDELIEEAKHTRKFELKRTMTEEYLEYEYNRNNRAERLSLLAYDIDGLYELDDGYYVFLADGIWTISWNSHAFHPEKVYMSKDTAVEVCRLLNEGLYSLEGEL